MNLEESMNKREIDVFYYADDILQTISKGVVITVKDGNQVNARTISWGTRGSEWEKKYLPYL